MPTDKFIEIGDNETLSTIVEKINANFNQVRSLGGGPQGPQGKQGIPGLPGLQGPQGIKGDKGEAGTKIVPLESRPNDQDMELGYLYIYSDDNKNLFASYLEDIGGDEVERVDTKIVDNKIISSDGYLEQINTRDESTVMTRLIKRSVSEEGREAGLKIGVGESGKNESVFSSNISCIDADEDCSPENSSKLLLFSRKNFGAKLPIRGEDKQVYASTQLFIGSEKTSSIIGTYEYGSDKDNNGIAILGYEGNDANLFVNGEVMCEKGFTTNFSGDTKVFGGKGENGDFNFGNVNNDNTLKSGLNVKGSDVTLLGDQDVYVHSKRAMKLNVDMNTIDNTVAAITIDTKGRKGYLLDYKAAEGEGSTLTIQDNGSDGLTITNANKPFVINGLNGDVEMQFMKKQGAESPGSFHMSFGKDGGSEDGGIFADYDRISYYGKDGMQIKLSNINTTLEREYSNNANDKHIYSNLIEFCYERQSSSSGKDYVFGPSELNIINKCKIGEIIATADITNAGSIENVIENVNMNIISNNSLNIESLKNNVNIQAANEVSIKTNKNRIIFFNENNNDKYYFYLDYLKTEMFDLYIDKVYKYLRKDGNDHVCEDITDREFSEKLDKIIGKIIFSGKQAYIKIDLSPLNDKSISWTDDPNYQSICITFKIKYRTYHRKLKTGLGYDDYGYNNEDGVKLNFLNVGGNYTPHLPASTDTKTHVWFFRSAYDDGSYYKCESTRIYEPLLCIECEYIDSKNAKLLTTSAYINAHIATDVSKNV